MGTYYYLRNILTNYIEGGNTDLVITKTPTLTNYPRY